VCVCEHVQSRACTYVHGLGPSLDGIGFALHSINDPIYFGQEQEKHGSRGAGGVRSTQHKSSRPHPCLSSPRLCHCAHYGALTSRIWTQHRLRKRCVGGVGSLGTAPVGRWLQVVELPGVRGHPRVVEVRPQLPPPSRTSRFEVSFWTTRTGKPSAHAPGPSTTRSAEVIPPHSAPQDSSEGHADGMPRHPLCAGTHHGQKLEHGPALSRVPPQRAQFVGRRLIGEALIPAPVRTRYEAGFNH